MMVELIMSQENKVIHAVATCLDCGWMEDDYKIAQRRGRKHAKKMNHKVSIEVGFGYHVGGGDDG